MVCKLKHLPLIRKPAQQDHWYNILNRWQYANKHTNSMFPYLKADRICVHHLFQAWSGNFFTFLLVRFRNCFRDPDDMYSVMKITCVYTMHHLEDLGLLGWDIVLLGQCLQTFLQKVCTHQSTHTASHSGSPISSKNLWKLKNSQCQVLFIWRFMSSWV